MYNSENIFWTHFVQINQDNLSKHPASMCRRIWINSLWWVRIYYF